MLTSDLLRYRIDAKTITPRYLIRRHAGFYLNIAQRLIDIYRSHIGKKRCELERALENFAKNRSAFKALRGLAKILDGSTQFETEQKIDYSEFRRQFFIYAERFRPIVRQPDWLHKNDPQTVLKNYRDEAEDLPMSLYGDLPSQHILVALEHEYSPAELIRRYNLALAQGLLYRCIRLEIWLRDSFKTFFHYLKLARLMHKISKTPAAYHIIVDGPFSLFRQTQKYGTQLARFLPGLLLAENWQMIANIQTPEGARLFSLDQNCGLTSFYKKENPFDSTIEARFYDQFVKLDSLWHIIREAEVIDLGDTVMIPDFKFIHPDGRSFLLEIMGFWTPAYLQMKLSKLRRAHRNDLIVAVNQNLNCSKSDFCGPVIYYKTRVQAKTVLEILETADEKVAATKF